MDIEKKVTRQFRMYTYRIRGKRGPFKIILPASFCSFLTLPGMSGSPPSFSDYQYFYSFMDRNVHAHFYRQSDHYWRYPLNERILSGIVIFFFSGRLCRNRCCTFLDFQNRFDKVCRIVFRFVHRPLADSFRRNLLQNGNASAFQDLKSGAHPYLPYNLAVCSCMDIIYIRFSVTYFLYSFHSAWSFLFSLERALPEKFHFLHRKN